MVADKRRPSIRLRAAVWSALNPRPPAPFAYGPEVLVLVRKTLERRA